MTQATEPSAVEPQRCCRCGHITRAPILVDEVHTAAGAGGGVYACPSCAPQFLPRPGPAALSAPPADQAYIPQRSAVGGAFTDQLREGDSAGVGDEDQVVDGRH